MTALAVEVLTQAKATIHDPAHWGKGTFARTASGEGTFIGSPTACKFCSAGAVAKAAILMPNSKVDAVMQFLIRAVAERMNKAHHQVDEGLVYFFNDTRTHAEVMQVFDRAIELATPTPSQPIEQVLAEFMS